jgi:hypothetical protein
MQLLLHREAGQTREGKLKSRSQDSEHRSQNNNGFRLLILNSES